MKKIINSPETVVAEMCNGMVIAYPDLEFIPKYKIIKRKNINENKVSIISGGGSGHEPAHAGFVGTGMLDAAVCGDVFASPSQVQVYKAIKETATKEGTLLIIKNYSGDIMNFKNAKYLAEEDGIKVDYVKVDDDIAVQDSLYTVGRRGVAGTVLVHKVAGAAAEKGYNLENVKNVAQNAIENVKSIGFAFSSCTVPAKGTPTFDIAEDEMEYGIGIHGEPGIKIVTIISADKLANKMVNDLLNEFDFNENDTFTLLINGFGSTPLQELYLFNNCVAKVFANKNIKIYRVFVGNYMTSIDMLGASISIMKMNETLKEFIDSKSDTPAFKVDKKVEFTPYLNINLLEESKEVDFNFITDKSFSIVKEDKITLNNIIYIVDKMSVCIIENEVAFCQLDSYAGDGDFGMSISKGFKQLKREWHFLLKNHCNTIGEFLEACSIIIMEHCGGASGPIWGSAFRAAGKFTSNKIELTVLDFAKMLQKVVEGIQKTGERSFGRGAIVGDKTLIDALSPCVDKWIESANQNLSVKEAFKKGALAAVEGAKNTEKIVARMGRAGTVGDRSLGYPDAGAYALGVIFTEIANSLN